MAIVDKKDGVELGARAAEEGRVSMRWLWRQYSIIMHVDIVVGCLITSGEGGVAGDG